MSVSGVILKTNLQQKNYYLDEKKIRRGRSILGAKTETAAIDAALDLIVFRKDVLKSLEKVAGKGGVEKIFSCQGSQIDTYIYIDLIQRDNPSFQYPGYFLYLCKRTL